MAGKQEKRPENSKTGKITGGHDRSQKTAPEAIIGGHVRRKLLHTD
jgi:hypothetical protein